MPSGTKTALSIMCITWIKVDSRTSSERALHDGEVVWTRAAASGRARIREELRRVSDESAKQVQKRRGEMLMTGTMYQVLFSGEHQRKLLESEGAGLRRKGFRPFESRPVKVWGSTGMKSSWVRSPSYSNKFDFRMWNEVGSGSLCNADFSSVSGCSCAYG